MVDLSNAFSGSGVGAGIGSAFGPIGTAAGGLLGGIGGLFGAGRGKPEKIKQMRNYTPSQEALLDRALQMAKEGNEDAFRFLQSILGDEEGAFEDFEAPYMEQFQKKTVPGLLDRLNIGDNRYSSDVTNSITEAGRGLSRDLASLRSNLKFNAMNQINNLAQTGLTPRTTPYIKGGRQGALSMLAPSAAQGYQSLLNNSGSSNYGQQFSNLMNRFRGGI